MQRLASSVRAWRMATILALMAMASALAVPPTAAAVADSTVQRARTADAFVDSIGVVTHLHYTDRVYGQRYADIIKPRLVELGVRHVADSLYTYPAVSRDSFFYRRIKELGDSGIRFSLGASIETPRGDRTDLRLLDDIHGWTGGAIEAFVGANEPDLAGVDDWVDRTRALQRDLWNTVQADPALQDLAVLGPSPVWDPRALGDLSRWADYGNWHPYPGGECPTCADVYGGSFGKRIDAYRAPTGSKPLIATETGYHNATVGEQGHRPTSERAAGKYVPRLLFEYFNRGIARSHLYELIDLRDDATRRTRDEHFGLLRNDGSRKPAFIATRNLIDLLEDPGPAFTPSTLGFALEGETDKVHTALLQKRNGAFYLALWQERSSYDTGQRANQPDAVSARRDIAVPTQRVTVTTDELMSRARLYLPSSGTGSQRDWTTTDLFVIDVPDEVVLLELMPAGTPEPPATTPPPLDVTEACDGAARGVFSDVPASHTFAAEIDCLYAWGLTRGAGSGRAYAPAQPLPRWQMAVFIDRLALMEHGRDATAPAPGYDDIGSLSTEAQNAIARLTELGVVNGKTSTSFAPFDLVTRAQVAAFLNRLRGLNGDAGTDSTDYFADDDHNVHEHHINAIAGAGVVRGIGNGSYRPNAHVNRGQMSAMLVRFTQTRINAGRLDVSQRH